MRDMMELAGLAHRRYPDVPIELALRFFESDRRNAGLGALDERKRRGGPISNYKRQLMDNGQVRWHLVRNTPARREYAPSIMDRWGSLTELTAEITVQTVTIPARNEHLCVPADHRELRDQSGRRRAAALLWQARRQLSALSKGA